MDEYMESCDSTLHVVAEPSTVRLSMLAMREEMTSYYVK